jgi:DNA mismatch endonuclease (patch repair protein)
MRRIRSKDMSPELRVRHILFQLGFRYRLHRSALPGHPDIVFPGRRKVIFVHGCFWHQHPLDSCRIKRLPKSNLDYWIPKLQRNVERDAQSQAALRSLEWKTLTIWECEVEDAGSLRRRLRRFLSS